MKLDEIFECLCVYDPRSPYYDVELWVSMDEKPPEPRDKCYCDNCFTRRDELAMEILRLLEVLVSTSAESNETSETTVSPA